MAVFRFILRLLLAALFLFVGTFHLIDPGFFMPIMPPWVPFHLFCIEASGVLELLGGIALLVPIRQVQILAGIGLALLLLAVLPANIYMAIAHIKIHGFPSHPWMAWARVPVQFLLILAVLWVTDVGPKTSRLRK